MKMKNITKTTLTLATLAGIALAATSANAATIAHLGNYIDYGDGWRSTGDPDKDGGGGVAGSDPNGDNAWSSDGYYVANQGALASSLPGYIASVTDNRGGISSDALLFDDPTLSIAPVVSADIGGAFWQNAPVTFTLTLAQDATFVISVIFDAHTNPAYYIENIAVAGPGASDDTTGLTNDGTADYAFFEVSGNAGDVFTVTNGTGFNALAGLGFEAVPVPEPGTFALALLGLGLIGFRRRRN